MGSAAESKAPAAAMRRRDKSATARIALLSRGQLGDERLALRRLQPFPGNRLGALIADELAAAGLFFGADRLWVLAELRSHRYCLLDRRALADLCEPAFDIGELVDVDLAARPARRPGIADHVGDRILAGSEIALVEEAEVHDPVDAVGLVVKAAQGVGEIAMASGLFGAPKMTLLAEFRPLIGQLPADPLRDIVSAAHVLRIKASGLFGEIHHDRPGFEDRDRRAAAERLGVNDRRHPSIRRNPQKMRGQLITAADIDRLYCC